MPSATSWSARSETSPGVCYRVLGDRHDAEEAAQEAFVSAYRTLPAWRGDGPFGAWVARIALHVALRRRKNARPVAWIDPAALDGASDPLAGGADTGGQRQVARHFRDASVRPGGRRIPRRSPSP